jgi:hypothetical protein
MKDIYTEPYMLDGKTYQVYKYGKEPNSEEANQPNNYKIWFEEAEKQLSKSLLQISKDRVTIGGLNSACMFLEKGIRELMVKLHESVVIITEMSNPIYVCQSEKSDRCKCELCVKDRAAKFVVEIGIDLPKERE